MARIANADQCQVKMRENYEKSGLSERSMEGHLFPGAPMPCLMFRKIEVCLSMFRRKKGVSVRQMQFITLALSKGSLPMPIVQFF